MSPEQPLLYASMERAIESMHWLFDVNFEEDWCLIEDKVLQQHLNMFRKAAINLIKISNQYQNLKSYLQLYFKVNVCFGSRKIQIQMTISNGLILEDKSKKN